MAHFFVRFFGSVGVEGVGVLEGISTSIETKA